jgi:hypothetical protein
LWIHSKTDEFIHHFLVILFHLLLKISVGIVLGRLLCKSLSCGLPSELGSFHCEWWVLLIAELLFFILFWSESCMESFWSLRRFKEVLFRSGRLNVHLVLVIGKVIVGGSVIRRGLVDEVIGSVRRIISFCVAE